MQTAFFQNIRTQIIPLLKEAKENVYIAMAWFTSAELFKELISCLRRGVRVELVLLEHPTNFMYYAPDFNEFIKAGGVLRIASSELGFLHHKFCIIDRHIVINGSYNWTYYAETRNLENILITDNKDIVNLFTKEFKQLSDKIESVTCTPRLTWEEIEGLENIDFRELNYEVEQISKIQNRPIRKIFETKTQVFITEVKYQPYSAYNIGIASDKGTFEVIIRKDVKLPFASEIRTLHFNSKKYKELPCHFIYGIDTDVKLIKEDDLIDIINGVISTDLHIDFKMRLDDNGNITIEASCKETGKKKIITALNQKFVKYE